MNVADCVTLTGRFNPDSAQCPIVLRIAPKVATISRAEQRALAPRKPRPDGDRDTLDMIRAFHRPCTAPELAERFKISKKNTMHTFKRMVDEGKITRVKAGRNFYYTVSK